MSHSDRTYVTLIFVPRFILTVLKCVALYKSNWSHWPSHFNCVYILDKIHSLNFFTIQNVCADLYGYFFLSLFPFPFQNLHWPKNILHLLTDLHCCHGWITLKTHSILQRHFYIISSLLLCHVKKKLRVCQVLTAVFDIWL